jgi:deoxyribodipyrimidine photo-lyase
MEVPVWEVDTNVVVPVDVTSDKREYAARTIRPKIHEHLDRFLIDLDTTALERSAAEPPGGLSLESVDATLESLDVEAPPSEWQGGEHQARATLRAFIDGALDRYRDGPLDPSGGSSSKLSPYLHFGQVSPVFAVNEVQNSDASNTAIDAFVEEVVVRRELAHNYVWFEPRYDRYGAVPDWARTTLERHRSDERPEIHTATELERGETDDPVWNAAMDEMRTTGYLHNHLRMYWGKRILTWTRTPEYAFRVALELNNRYLLDGRDANSYANIGWLFGLHDRAFGESQVFGKVRPMTPAGLERKIDTSAYIERVSGLRKDSSG